MGEDDLQSFFARYGDLVYRRARRLLGEAQAAEDACQEVFLRLWRTRPAFGAVSPVTWLYRVTTNHCLNVVRDTRRRRALLGTRPVEPAASAPGQALASLLEGVPEPLQEVGLYYYVNEMTQEEI